MKGLCHRKLVSHGTLLHGIESIYIDHLGKFGELNAGLEVSNYSGYRNCTMYLYFKKSVFLLLSTFDTSIVLNYISNHIHYRVEKSHENAYLALLYLGLVLEKKRQHGGLHGAKILPEFKRIWTPHIS